MTTLERIYLYLILFLLMFFSIMDGFKISKIEKQIIKMQQATD